MKFKKGVAGNMELDILDIILDENNKENIVFEDADGKNSRSNRSS